MGEEYQSEDLHVHISNDFFDKIPITSPFKSINFEMLIVKSGEIKIQTNLIKHTIRKNESISLKPNEVIQILEISNNLKAIAISFSNNFIFDNFFNKNTISGFDLFTMVQIPKITLTKKEVKIFNNYAKQLKHNNAQKNTSVFKTEIIRNIFGAIIFTYAEIYKKKYPELKVELNRQEEIVVRFWNILQENVKTERTVQFYADALNVSAGYLSKVLKQVTNKNASQLIDEAVILEARLLLENSALSITEIAEELNFSDQSFFGKYFKKHIGFSPSQFRKTNSK